jgi:predicted nucleic acid-binding protein
LGNRVLVDTGALLALAYPLDQYHDVAANVAREHRAAGGRFVGTLLVVSELHTLLLHRRGPADARRVVGALLSDPFHEWVDVTVELARSAVSAWLERFADQRFTLCDAVSFEVMRRQKLTTAFAFDDDFVTAGFDVLR